VTLVRKLRDIFWSDQPEALAVAHYRGFLRIVQWVSPLLLLLNFLSRDWFAGRPGYDLSAYDRFLILNTPGHVLAVGAALSSRWTTPVRWLRLETILCTLFLNWTTACGLWMAGGESQLNFVFFLVLVALCRGYYDARIGLVALVSAVLLIVGLYGAQFAGLLQSNAVHPAAAWPIRTWQDLTVVLGWQVALLLIAYIGAGALTNRIRRGERELERERIARLTLEARLHERETGRLSGSTMGGEYEVLELLGRGGMGEVYAARDRSGAPLAIKVLHAQLGAQPEMLERFRREAQALEKIGSAHVPRMRGIGQTAGGDHYIVMERLEGEDLGAFLRRRGRLAPEQVSALVGAIATALDAAHAAGLVHRDLKPQNIFVTAEDTLEIRLLDFGVSRLLDTAGDPHGLTRSAIVIGSPGYLAPEQAVGRPEDIGPHTDVFALGAVAYRALTGENAFPSRSASAAIYEAAHHRPVAPSKLHSGLHADVDLVLELALAKQPSARYPRAGDFATDLGRAVVGQLDEATRERGRLLLPTPGRDGQTLTAVAR